MDLVKVLFAVGVISVVLLVFSWIASTICPSYLSSCGLTAKLGLVAMIGGIGIWLVVPCWMYVQSRR